MYKTVTDKNQQCVLVRWACSMKTKNGLKPKARLVANGFEEDCLNKSEKELSTCYKDTFHLILLLAIQTNGIYKP